MAEDEETFVDELGVEKTSNEIDDLVGEEVKLEDKDSVTKLMLHDVDQYHLDA